MTDGLEVIEWEYYKVAPDLYKRRPKVIAIHRPVAEIPMETSHSRDVEAYIDRQEFNLSTRLPGWRDRFLNDKP